MCIVTGDEEQIHYSDPESEYRSMGLICLQTPVKGKFRVQPTASKGMLTGFFFYLGVPVAEHSEEECNSK